VSYWDGYLAPRIVVELADTIESATIDSTGNWLVRPRSRTESVLDRRTPIRTLSRISSRCGVARGSLPQRMCAMIRSRIVQYARKVQSRSKLGLNLRYEFRGDHAASFQAPVSVRDAWRSRVGKYVPCAGMRLRRSRKYRLSP